MGNFNLKILLISKFIGIILIIILIIFNLLKKPNNNINSTNIIDLTNIKPNLSISEPDDGLVVYTNEKTSNNIFKPMFRNPLNARKKSPTNSIHLVVAGLMPAPIIKWNEYNESTIFYMPNDITPHYHGEATHHMNLGFNLDRVYILSKETYENSNKQLINFRNNLYSFNTGQPISGPIETWIHWKIPSNQVSYKTLIVKRYSIIWWDFSNNHNLCLINDETRYNDNLFDTSLDIEIKDNINQNMNIVVTIMDKLGTFYFLCSLPEHASIGHKIIIKVI